jgi:hypothetical protein
MRLARNFMGVRGCGIPPFAREILAPTMTIFRNLGGRTANSIKGRSFTLQGKSVARLSTKIKNVSTTIRFNRTLE